MRLFIPNLLIVCGSGRKVGKTTFVKSLITHFKEKNNIAAIKISSHLHSNKHPKNIIFQENDCNIYLENEITNKDSSLFFQAGAEPTYYIESKDYKLEKAFLFIINNIGDNRPIVCESGALARIFKPGILIFVESKVNNVQNNDKITNRKIADIIVTVENGKLNDELTNLKKKIIVEENQWKLV